MSHVTEIASVVGMFTGIIGAALGWLGYRRSGRTKELDLRIELRKAVSDVHAYLDDARGAISAGERSHAAVLIARGLSGSGAMQAWRNTIATDTANINRLAEQIPERTANFLKLGAPAIETMLVEIHGIKRDLFAIKIKYDGSLAADDRAREEIRADMRSLGR